MKNKLFFFIQAVLRYFPFKLGLSLRNLLYPPFFKFYGKNVRIFDGVMIKYPNDIEIHDNVTINQFCYIVGKGGLYIGSNVMIGSGSKMATSNHEFESLEIPMCKQGMSFSPIILREDVWLGFNVVILGGAVVERGCILAAGTVVLGNVYPAYSILGGVPSRIISSRIKEN